MAQGSKKKYTSKQKRKAHDIAYPQSQRIIRHTLFLTRESSSSRKITSPFP